MMLYYGYNIIIIIFCIYDAGIYGLYNCIHTYAKIETFPDEARLSFIREQI